MLAAAAADVIMDQFLTLFLLLYIVLIVVINRDVMETFATSKVEVI